MNPRTLALPMTLLAMAALASPPPTEAAGLLDPAPKALIEGPIAPEANLECATAQLELLEIGVGVHPRVTVRALCNRMYLYGELSIRQDNYRLAFARIEGLTAAVLDTGAEPYASRFCGAFDGWLVGDDRAQEVHVRSCRLWQPPPEEPLASDGTSATWSVRDTGFRCIAAPCMYLEAVDIDGGEPLELSGLDLSGLPLPLELQDLAYRRIVDGVLLAVGFVRTVPDAGPAGDGRVLVVTSFALASRGR